jgi:C-terminal processing protease CtpA/Prc
MMLALLVTAAFNTLPSAAQGPADQPDMTIDARVKTEVIDAAIKSLNEGYIFPEVAKKMETMLRDRLQKKEYDEVTSAKQFATLLTNQLQEVSKDKHLRVRYSHEAIPQRERREPTPEEIEDYKKFGRSINFGFEKVERMEGNIGYLDMRGFFGADAGAPTAAAAMNFLANSDALIIDLRKNGGGDPAMVAFVTSYLYDDQPVHLNDLYFRPDDSTRQWWTLPHVPGQKLGSKKDVYVLISKRTFSAAEEFTYNLKNLKRATIVGETTGGGAHPGGVRRLNANFGMFVPSGRAINPISKTNWEGTGVKPDIEVPADHALKVAQITAIQKLKEKSKDQDDIRRYERLLDTAQKELDELKKNQKP